MSGSRVPVLCRPATRQEVREYVARARAYARAEFERGHDEAAVLRRLRRKTPGIAMTYQVEEEYLRYLGVSPSAVIGSRVLSGVLAVAVFLAISPLFHSLPQFNVVLPGIMAIAAGLGFQKLVRTFWKRQKRGQASS